MIVTYTNNPLRIVSSIRKCPKLIKNRRSNKRNKAMMYNIIIAKYCNMYMGERIEIEIYD